MVIATTPSLREESEERQVRQAMKSERELKSSKTFSTVRRDEAESAGDMYHRSFMKC